MVAEGAKEAGEGGSYGGGRGGMEERPRELQRDETAE